VNATPKADYISAPAAAVTVIEMSYLRHVNVTFAFYPGETYGADT